MPLMREYVHYNKIHSTDIKQLQDAIVIAKKVNSKSNYIS
jgi:hypothetical protein